MEIAFLGNFIPLHSTESHLASTLELLFHTVTRIQEGDTRAADVPALVANHDLFVHTQTYDLAVRAGTESERAQMYERIHAAGIPMIGWHLDRWWNLARATQLTTDPYFTHLGRLGILFTADGGNQDKWNALGIRHHWMPPGVFGPECVVGTSRPQYRSRLAFVGNWRGKYHPESVHRHELITFLSRTYRQIIKFWPRNQAIRGQALSDLYSSTDIVIGDSCFTGTPFTSMYYSDRIPETLGRGGFLLHPRVSGVTDGTLFIEGEHLACWEAGNWDELKSQISYYFQHRQERQKIATQGRAMVAVDHTYTRRVRQVCTILGNEGVLDPGMYEPSEVPWLVSDALPSLVQDRRSAKDAPGNVGWVPTANMQSSGL